MSSKKEDGKKNKDDKETPIATVLKDDNGREYHLKGAKPNTDVDFYKIYLSRFSSTLDGVMNQKMKLVLWIIRKMTLNNELKYSYREIARLSGISYQTVAETIKTLIEDDFMRRNDKTLMVNPYAVFRGGLAEKNFLYGHYKKIKNQPEKEAEEEQDKDGQAETPGKGQERKTKKETKKKPEKKQEKEPKKKPEKKLERKPLSMKDRNDLTWELREISNEINRLKNWRDNLETQLYFDEKKDVSGELEKITKDIEKLSDRVKYISMLLSLAEPPEEEDKKDGNTQTKEPET